MSTADSVELHDSIRFKHARGGRVIADGFSGYDLHRKSGRWMQKERLIDRENNRYLEKVTDPRTGQIVHHCEEPLTQHTGHGTRKRRK